MLSPLEREALLATYENGPAELVRALEDFPRPMWTFKPSPNAWSIHEILIHLPDSETNSFGRFRAAIAQPNATIFAYDQDEWARKLDYHAQDPLLALDLLKNLRALTSALLRRQPLHVWAQTIVHPENGIMSLDDLLITYARHIPDHIAQMRENQRLWLASGG
jgi:hypothetical protein